MEKTQKTQSAEDTGKSPNAAYETDEAAAQYLDAHYGQRHFGVGNFPVNCVAHALSFMGARPRRRALDLGCAVGRASFELARHFESVTGLDYSRRFIGIAKEIQSSGTIRYALTEEGEIVSHHQERLIDLGLAPFTDRVRFFQADAARMPERFSNYDLILAANLIDRLPDPARLLTRIHERLAPGGILMITSPYTWLATFTPRDRWLGGFYGRDGRPHTALEGLDRLLEAHFRRTGSPVDIEFVIRETARKFQHTLAQATVWEYAVSETPEVLTGS
jgi:putative 4-mercaptohistidine N1-methyltranferase